MASADKTPSGPDFTKGVRATDLAEGAMLVGRVGDDEVILARQGGKLFAVSAHCTHYMGRLSRVSSSAKRSAVHGTMRVSVCKRAKPWPRRR